ncbi:MAG: hypothetical protein EOP05_12605 [Proteobacteria bacterium]|nr:MAG: hypothetical protein EOP05_12605 [Pseudomonadota bacterium]
MELSIAVPEVLAFIDEKKLCLQSAADIQTFLNKERGARKPYSAEAKASLVAMCTNLSTREVQRHLAALNPQVDFSQSKRFVSADRMQVTHTVSVHVEEKLDRIKGLLAHVNPYMNREELLDAIAEIALDKLDPIRKAERARKREAKRQDAIKQDAQKMDEIGKYEIGKYEIRDETLECEERARKRSLQQMRDEDVAVSTVHKYERNIMSVAQESSEFEVGSVPAQEQTSKDKLRAARHKTKDPGDIGAGASRRGFLFPPEVVVREDIIGEFGEVQYAVEFDQRAQNRINFVRSSVVAYELRATMRPAS